MVAVNSITDVITAYATVDQTYDYTPFGVLTDPSVNADASLPKPILGYAGGLTNPDSTISLGARQYNANLGRFISPDPSGPTGAGYSTGGYDNPYNYVHNQPLLLTDPLGLCAWNPFTDHPDACFIYNMIADVMAGRGSGALGKLTKSQIEYVVGIGRGAFGTSDDIAEKLSPGASCTVSHDSVAAQAGRLSGKLISEFVALGKGGLTQRNGPRVNWGQQSKHLIDSPNYEPGKSILKADPQVLLLYAGLGSQVGSVPRGQPGFRERIDFGRTIGTYIDQDGNMMPTTVGIIHYRKDGTAHIVPGRPT